MGQGASARPLTLAQRKGDETLILYIVVAFVIGAGLGWFHDDVWRFFAWAVKRYKPFLLTFIVGVGVGVVGPLVYRELSKPSDQATEKNWLNMFMDEDNTHRKMIQFQTQLEALETDSIADTKSKIEAQGEILDIIVKFRDAQHAKYNWLVNALGGAALGAVATLLAQRGANR